MRDAYLIVELDATSFQPVDIHIWSDTPWGQSRLPNGNAYLVAYQTCGVEYGEASDQIKQMLRRVDLLPASGGWPTWAKLFAEKEAVRKARMQGEPVPPGIYWNADADNFYDMSSRKGMGTDFYDDWYRRASEFPTSPVGEAMK